MDEMKEDAAEGTEEGGRWRNVTKKEDREQNEVL
jgi:hypothetical protein